MIAKRHPDTTRWLGAPKGWQPEQNGPCGHLAIADVRIEGGVPAMCSRWEPTPDELQLLNAGGSIELLVIGTGHPPVSLIVVPMTNPQEEPV